MSFINISQLNFQRAEVGKTFSSQVNNLIIRKNDYSSKILYTWEFFMNGVNHKVEYWDSRISGKKKLAVDGKVLTLAKDADNFTFHFKIGEYFFVVLQNEDEKPKLLINNRDFNVILKDERTGKLQKENENYNKNKKSEIKKNIGTSETDYYKRALKYNGDNYVEGNDGEIYDIEEQRKRLEEFEKKKEKENEEKKRRNKINSDNDKINKNNDINKKQEKKNKKNKNIGVEEVMEVEGKEDRNKNENVVKEQAKIISVRKKMKLKQKEKLIARRKIFKKK